LLAADGGYGLLLGVGFESNTYHHVVETIVGATCLGQRTVAIPMKLPDGRMVEGRSWTWRERACPLTDRLRYAQIMEKRGMCRHTAIGACRVTMFRLLDCYDVAGLILREGSDNLPPCRQCPIRPRSTGRPVESDWDQEHQCLLPDSPALEY
jgi:aminoglycoside N3'-acetyltransferase